MAEKWLLWTTLLVITIITTFYEMCHEKTMCLMGKWKYNPLVNLLGFIILTNKKRKTPKAPSTNQKEE